MSTYLQHTTKLQIEAHSLH